MRMNCLTILARKSRDQGTSWDWAWGIWQAQVLEPLAFIGWISYPSAWLSDQTACLSYSSTWQTLVSKPPETNFSSHPHELRDFLEQDLSSDQDVSWGMRMCMTWEKSSFRERTSADRHRKKLFTFRIAKLSVKEYISSKNHSVVLRYI